MNSPVLIRRAGVLDAAPIARIHVDGWRAAYRGLIDDAVLDSLDVGVRKKHWASLLSYAEAPLESGTRAHVTIVAERAGEVVAWCSYGGGRDAGEVRGEISALSAAPDAWGTGAGRALVVEAERALRTAGYRAAYLWVLDGNARAIHFYERQGWTDDGAVKIGEAGGVTGLREHRHSRDFDAAGQRAGMG